MNAAEAQRRQRAAAHKRQAEAIEAMKQQRAAAALAQTEPPAKPEPEEV